MNIVLTAINAKYIHSNLAVYSLKAYAGAYREQISIAEYTINQRTDEILMDLYKRQPEILCFSCYIWNLTYVEELVRNIKKILPHTRIWLGGPEVSYDAESVLKRYPEAELVMKGEGEATFLELLDHVCQNQKTDMTGIKGITYRNTCGGIVDNAWREVIDLSEVPFVYDDLKQFEHKIIYYETSRGCPFSCSYCLSSVEKKLRFRSLDLVKQELQHFLDHKVPQVKFVDRTFNCNHGHAMEIWKFIKEHDNGITNFHFEAAADLLKEEEIELIKTMRSGLIQLEIGVQSTNSKTIDEICRKTEFAKAASVVKEIESAGNVHLHLDLIAGLPHEDYNSFARSFNEVYALHPEQLQLGFLKVLKGSFMEVQKEAYGLVYKDEPPYEVLSTDWLIYEDIVRLKQVEEMVEVYYNSGQFTATLPHLEQVFETPFRLYEALGNYYEVNGLFRISHSRVKRYEILLDFAKCHDGANEDRYRQLVTFDLYLREKLKSRPAFAKLPDLPEQAVRCFYEKEAEKPEYLRGYEAYDKRQLRKMTHIEHFSVAVNGDGKEKDNYILFDYRNRNPLNHQAAIFPLNFNI